MKILIATLGVSSLLFAMPASAGSLRLPAATLILAQDFPPGSTERVLNAGEAQQLSVGISAKGNLTGVSIETGWTAGP